MPQAALAAAEQQLTQLQQETAAGQVQLEAQAKEISSLQELTNLQKATIDNTARQAEETQQQLTELVAMLKVRCLAHPSVPAHTVCHLNAHANLLSTYCVLWAHGELWCTARSGFTPCMVQKPRVCNTPFYMLWDKALECVCGLRMCLSDVLCSICFGRKWTETMLLQ